MTVLNVQKDLPAMTMLVTAELDAGIERAWQLLADPRKLERWWGPPTYPATFVKHDLSPGAAVTYYMTGPEGDRHHGWWRVVSVEPPRRLVVEDGFGEDPDHSAPDLPVIVMTLVLTEAGAGKTRLTIESKYPSVEAMEKVLAMGMEEGLKAALGQIDGVLREA